MEGARERGTRAHVLTMTLAQTPARPRHPKSTLGQRTPNANSLLLAHWLTVTRSIVRFR